VTPDVQPDRGAIAFAERVIALLDEGAFTATYKFAVLLALLDLCLERLIRHLNALGRDAHIVVTPKPRSRDHATVRVIGRSRAPRSGRAARAG